MLYRIYFRYKTIRGGGETMRESEYSIDTIKSEYEKEFRDKDVYLVQRVFLAAPDENGFVQELTADELLLFAKAKIIQILVPFEPADSSRKYDQK